MCTYCTYYVQYSCKLCCHCSVPFRRLGGYWYDDCDDSNLNGYQYIGNDTIGYKGITWLHWSGATYSHKATSMMIR
ncbi:Angiopoietin-2 [Portunus trituberculatus]|uniref:Angiopoietin-2 n=1 Tax=Portunus trituberculatus TaxID=210409 RepID=A0A5B7HJH3_PORTR|nr:Angiopoietin-2 [Portunus trituberculatus]